MSKFLEPWSQPSLAARAFACVLFVSTSLGAAQAVAQTALQNAAHPGIGRAATPKEVAAWDIDVRPDFKGLPAGAGSVAKGQDVWESKCAHCHGVFGESGEVFSPLVGGTTVQDVATGRVANLTRDDYPGRTTIMKVATLSTLWDYINRAMPWTAPKSLSTDEVYAVTAFLLNLANVVPDDFVLSNHNMTQVQARMPNRNGMTTAHAMWPGSEFGGSQKPDTANSMCMKNCKPEARVASFLPDFARNAHGNLQEQNRSVGPQRGADTLRPEATPTSKASAAVQSVTSAAQSARATTLAPAPAAATVADKPNPQETKAVLALLNQYSCTACHGVDKKIVGPSFQSIAQKQAARQDAKTEYLAGKILAGSVGVYGPIPMPPQTLPQSDVQRIARWIAQMGPTGAGQ